MRNVADNEPKRNKINMLTEEKICDLIEMDPDGDCMLRAIVHQVYGISSKNKKEFNRFVQEFRTTVANHIEKNMNGYIKSITNSIYENDKSNKINKVTVNDCENYVKNELRTAGNWGGLETLKATSKLFNVNILRFNEGNTIEYNFFDEENTRTILLGYRYIEVKETRKKPTRCYNHYDSVYGIDERFIVKKVKELHAKRKERK